MNMVSQGKNLIDGQADVRNGLRASGSISLGLGNDVSLKVWGDS